MSQEHELVQLAAELERYWSDQWRRAKEICDLLEQRVSGGSAVRPHLRVVSSPQPAHEAGPDEQSPPPLKLVDA